MHDLYTVLYITFNIHCAIFCTNYSPYIYFLICPSKSPFRLTQIESVSHSFHMSLLPTQYITLQLSDYSLHNSESLIIFSVLNTYCNNLKCNFLYSMVLFLFWVLTSYYQKFFLLSSSFSLILNFQTTDFVIKYLTFTFFLSCFGTDVVHLMYAYSHIFHLSWLYA